MANKLVNIENAQYTILFIDDNFNQYLEILTVVSTSFGFNIQAFDNINEGLAYLDINYKNIGSVILDICFPANEMQGIDALIKIKTYYDLLPVIMLTGSDSEKDIQTAVNCMKQGAYNYVGKEKFNPIYLFQVIQSAIKQFQINLELERYQVLKEEYRDKALAYEKMLYTTEMILKNILSDKLLFPPTFEKRIKDFESFYDKIKKKEKSEGFIAEPFRRFTDIAGIRVIFYNAVDLQRAVDLLKATTDFTDIKTGENIIADDKSITYGYRAVHFDIKLNTEKRGHLEEYQMLTDLPCEVQFKTIFAHAWSKVYHRLSYKQADDIKSRLGEQEMLDNDFKEAAQQLEHIEQHITDLCAKYFPIKLIPNDN
jgi:ppGpp synthetase/RelA/SpoT-type nucleotidyltranferase/CheY-like chemotaxis protein